MKYEQIVDAVNYGIDNKQISGFQNILKQFAKFSHDKGFMLEKDQLKKDFSSLSTFDKIGVIVTLPYSLILLSGLFGVGTVMFIINKLRSPEVVSYLLQNGVSEEEIERLTTLESSEEINQALYENGIAFGPEEEEAYVFKGMNNQWV